MAKRRTRKTKPRNARKKQVRAKAKEKTATKAAAAKKPVSPRAAPRPVAREGAFRLSPRLRHARAARGAPTVRAHIGANPFERDLDKNAANYRPLTPLNYLERAASIFPERVAIIHGTRRYSYREFYERAR